ELIPTWLCPNNPLTAVYVRNLIAGILERYPSRAILLDRLRYPDWSGATVSVARMLTCFCPYCLRKMEQIALDTNFLSHLLESFLENPHLLRS
ncbi:MAG: hypothetical protein GX335_03540, partial [Firmicutes bacterium]|nr:hypothetical protein [Bacillota bacterium]